MAIAQRIAGLMFALLWIGNVVRGAADTSQISAAWSTSQICAACNQATYQAGDSFAYGLAYVLSALETVTPNHPGYDYYSTSPYLVAVAYGHAACNPALSYPDCVTCISYVKVHLLNNCPSSVGAQLVLHDCRMRYEQYSFTD